MNDMQAPVSLPEANTSVIFDALSLQRFAAESHDRNPLHMDEGDARKSAFGQRVVFGALGGLQCLEGLPARPGRELARIDLEFRHPLFMGIEYRLHVGPASDQRTVVELRDGHLTLIRLQADFRPRASRPDDARQEVPAREDFPAAIAWRNEAKDFADEALRAGLELEGFYRVELPALRFPLCQVLLRLCSYLVGMEMPGRRALFSRVTLDFPEGEAASSCRTLKYRLATRAYEGEFGSLSSDLQVWSESGLLATGELKAFVRKDIARLPAATASSVPWSPADDFFKGKVALVTGGSRGLGAALVHALARRGCHVAVNFLASTEEAAALARALQNAPGEVMLLQGDARRMSWCSEAKRQILERFQRLDFLLCNACTPPVSLGFSAGSLARMQQYIDDNLALATTPLITFLETVAAGEGAVLGVSSIIVDSDTREWPHYKSLKSSFETFVQAAAAQHKQVSFILARPPELLTDMSNTPLRAASALRPEIAAEHIVEALRERGQPGKARIVNAFPEALPPAAKGGEPTDRIVVAATFTHEPLLLVAEYWRQALALDAEFVLAPYNQLFQDLLNPQGSLAGNSRGLNVILLRPEDWLRHFSGQEGKGPARRDKPSAQDKGRLWSMLDSFIEALAGYGQKSPCATLLLLCPASPHAGQHKSWTALLAEVEAALLQRVSVIPGVIGLRAADFHPAYQVQDPIHDAVRDELGHIPYTPEYFALLGTLIFRCHFHVSHPPCKVIVLDCDNTLWGGVCGEVGGNGVDIEGRFRRFQEFLAGQAGQGMLLCLCSKNNEEDVWAVFDANPSMPLKREHLIDSRINWNPKSGNLKSLAASLNLGLDSFIFIDDSALECAEVRSACPEVLTVQWPQTDREVAHCLDHLWVFDRFLVTGEDRKRTASYRSQVERNRLQDQAEDFASFLGSLNLQVDIQGLREEDLPRAAQLTQRTNQFNFTTLRKTPGEIQQWLARSAHECWTVKVSDRFGDYGLVGLLMLRMVDGEESASSPAVLELETLLLSCRVLGRGVEHRMLAEVGRVVRERNLAAVRILFRNTAKNRPARNFLESVAPRAREQGGEEFGILCSAEDLLHIEFVAPARMEPSAPAEDKAPAGSAVDPALVRKKEGRLSVILGTPRLADLSEAVGRQAREAAAARAASSSGTRAPGDAAQAAGKEWNGRGRLYERVLAETRELFSRTLGLAPDALAAEEHLENYGIDSLRIVELTVALKRHYPDLPVTFLFEHKSLHSVVAHLLENYRARMESAWALADGGSGDPHPDSSPGAPDSPEQDDQEQDDIAIIGINGRFPGAANVREFWENLKSGVCSIAEIPPERWEVDAFFDPAGQDGKSYTRLGGFLRDIDRFDSGFFHISPKEAELMDPQQRLMLESVWGLLEDAGYTRRTLDRDTGVFIGAIANDYAAYANNEALGGSGGAYRNADFYQIPNRISYFFDLHGPSLCIDSACSASGTSLYFAWQSLKSGACSMAIVGGINLFLHPSRFIQYSRMRMISPTSRCSPFGSEANGTMFGEGVGTLLLKPLARARRDGDHIYGVIKGCAVNSGGKTNGFTVPDPQAQAALIARAIRQAGVDSGSITYIEAHGTGTPLGDPIEIRGLTKAFADTAGDAGRNRQGRHCALGTVKANIGHLESGAAMAGIIKTLLQMKHKFLVPSLHAETLNPGIPFEDSPFRVQREAGEWKAIAGLENGKAVSLPRRAGINSFGAGGSNAHIIVEEYAAARAAAGAGPLPQLVVLSAHKKAALAERAGNLAAYLKAGEGAGLDLADIAYTLQVGREAMPERLALVADSIGQLLESLQSWLSAEPPAKEEGGSAAGQGNVQQGSVRPERGKAAAAVGRDDRPRSWSWSRAGLVELARAWVSGAEIDWARLHASRRGAAGYRAPARVSLPSYPFGGGRYWLPGHPNLKLSGLAGKGEVVNPEGDTVLSVQRTIRSGDALIRDHKVQGRTILPGVAYLDMALAAAGVGNRQRCRLERVVWSHPLEVQAGEKTLEIRLERKNGAIAYGMRSDPSPEAAPHSQGSLQVLEALPDMAAPRIPLEAIRRRCTQQLDQAAIYRRFEGMGIQYGAYFQGVERIFHNGEEGTEALGLLRLPAGHDPAAGGCVLHPTLMDGAFQTALQLAAGRDMGGMVLLPFAMDELEVHRPLPSRCLAYVRKTGENAFQIQVSDESGVVCVAAGNLVLRERKDALQSFFYLPRWKACGGAGEARDGAVPPSSGRNILIVPAEHHGSLAQGIAEFHRHDRIHTLAVGGALADAAAVDSRIAALGKIDRVYFLGGMLGHPRDIADPAELERSQEAGVLSLFRLVKALQRCELSRQPLEIKVITNDLHAIRPGEKTIPYAASLAGLAKVLAKEFPMFGIAAIDLGGEDLAACRSGEDWERMVRLILAEPDNRGEAILLRQGVRYGRTIEPLRLPVAGKIPFRQGGTYLVLGGAGGLGFEFSRHLAGQWQARVVWLGRREEDAGIREKMETIRSLGGEVLYCRADATDGESVKAAVAAARRRFGAIQGAVHSAIVLEDKMLAHMDEAAFRRGLEIKTKGSVALYQALQEEPLDFLLFFSSINSFQAAMGQGNYVAGCHFKDAFGLYLNGLAGSPLGGRVRIINWGYWGSVGIVASADYRDRLAAQGHRSIEPAEGMGAIERITGQSLPQVLAMKTDTQRQREIGVDLQARVEVYPAGIPPLLASLEPESIPPTVDGPAILRFQAAFEELEGLGRSMLVNAFQQMGVLLSPGEQYSRHSLRDALRIVPEYFPLYAALLDILRDCGVIRLEGEGIETTSRLLEPEFQAAASRLEQRCHRLADEWPEIRERLPLLAACHRAWPAVLTGSMNPMEALFPKGELTLVEGIYKGNAITESYNLRLAELVRRYLQKRSEGNPEETLRILEVGAGTGGTSLHVLEAIREFSGTIEYFYTDISRRFTQEGENKFGARYPFARFQLFDFEKDPVAQGLEPASMDLVLGTNCIHATRKIGASLGRIKSVLKKNGLLLINEFTRRLDYNTLTFGLTSGWWRFADGEFRIPGSPLLDLRRWQLVLESGGFRHLRFVSLPPTAKGEVGQHLIACESDGVVPWEAEPAADREPEMEERDPAGSQGDGISPASPAEEVAAAAGGLPRKEACRYVKGVFSAVLKMPAGDMEDHLTFDRFGVDSLISMAILNRFEKDFGTLSSTLLFEYMTIAELAGYFIARHAGRLGEIIGHGAGEQQLPAPSAGRQGSVARTDSPSAARPRPGLADSASCDIAIVGLAGRYPGADTLAQFWENLRNGRNCVGEIPAERWDWREALTPGGEGGAGRWGGFIADIDKFDSLFFNISPREAEKMDPQERLFLETVWQAFEHAGYTPQRLSDSQKRFARGIGVFVGCMYQQYPLLAQDPGIRGALSGTSYWSIANRVSYFFDLHGPSLAVDTACSSSLTAIHMACESLRRGECILAVAGGVNLNLHPGKYLNLQQAGMLGSTAESRSLGDGDGLIPAEGVGAVVLKPLDKAVADGDLVLGVIKSSSINNGGRTGGYTVPNPNAQADLIVAALERAGIHPETIGYVEVAANGSALGDPVEIAGLTKAFRCYTDKQGICAIGAVKSNLGHPEAASGMAQLTKALLQLQYRTLVPSLHAEPLNPKLRLENTPFYVQKTLAPWPRPPGAGAPEAARLPRRAAISSFGAGGSNAHLILEEFGSVTEGPRPAAAQAGTPQVIVLSAKSEDRLAARARGLLDFLGAAAPGEVPDLADVAYTLQTGREAMKVRLAFVAGSGQELLQKLERYCVEMAASADFPASILAAEGLVQNNLNRSPVAVSLLLDGEEGREYLDRVLASRKYEKIAQLWTMGVDMDWELLHPSRIATGLPRRCHLAGYPFARIRHWIAEAGAASSRHASLAAVAEKLDPPARSSAGPAARQESAGRPAARPAAGRAGIQERLRQCLREFIADILKVPIAEIDLDIGMREYGFDSINLANLTTRVNACFGLQLTADLFFGHPTIEKCARFLWSEYGEQLRLWHEGGQESPGPAATAAPAIEPAPERAAAATPVRLPVDARTANDDPIAIVGMSGLMPQSEDLASFWEHLVSGRELIVEIPGERLQRMGVSYQSLREQIQVPSLCGSFLNRVEAFDSLFFGISPREAELMDPQQRLFLETVWKTIEDAGYPASELAGSAMGVFVGVSNYDYGKLYQRMRGQAYAHASTGMMVQSILANRVSYLFDFRGPSEIVDTACSSSTVALHRAVRAIRNGECEAALVGGVNVLLDWQGYAVLQKAGILSRDGKVRMFSRDGTGYVRGEGVAAVLLKPLARAIADRDHIYALIKGSATNFDGKKYSLTAPSPIAQAQVVFKAFAEAGVNPADVRHIEAQGTGSPLGDPVEINAFKSAFRNLYQQWGLSMADGPHCGVGYLKPQIGHLESASGMAGLIKILLAMQHQVVPGTRNLAERDMTVSLDDSPFYVSRENRPWGGRESALRCAGLHSFGLGGVNAHVVLEEYLA